jgi:hypothetical protein
VSRTPLGASTKFMPSRADTCGCDQTSSVVDNAVGPFISGHLNLLDGSVVVGGDYYCATSYTRWVLTVGSGGRSLVKAPPYLSPQVCPPY